MKSTAYCKLVVLAGIGVLACSPVLVGWVEPNSTQQHFVFGLALSRHGQPLSSLQDVDVGPCAPEDWRDNQILWHIELTGYQNKAPTLFLYGSAPRLYKTTIGPKSLSVGCHEIRANRGFAVRFIVADNGSITEMVSADPSSRITSGYSTPPAEHTANPTTRVEFRVSKYVVQSVHGKHAHIFGIQTIAE